MSKTLLTVALCGFLGLFAQPRSHASDTIVDLAVGAENFKTLVAAVQAAGLVDALAGDGLAQQRGPRAGGARVFSSALELTLAADDPRRRALHDAVPPAARKGRDRATDGPLCPHAWLGLPTATGRDPALTRTPRTADSSSWDDGVVVPRAAANGTHGIVWQPADVACVFSHRTTVYNSGASPGLLRKATHTTRLDSRL